MTLYAEQHLHREGQAETTLATWQDQPEAKALLAKVDMLERLSDTLAGHAVAETITNAIGDELMEAEEALHALRQDAIDEALRAHPDDDDAGYLRDEFDDVAMTVAKALQYTRNANVTDVEITMLDNGAWRVAA